MVELVVDDRERQLLTPVLRHFLAKGYNPQTAESLDQIRLESPDGYVIVRSELLDHGEQGHTQPDADSGRTGDPDLDPVPAAEVVLSITSSSHDHIDLRHAVGHAVTEFGGLAARGDDPIDADHSFHDQRGIQRAVLRTPPLTRS